LNLRFLRPKGSSLQFLPSCFSSRLGIASVVLAGLVVTPAAFARHTLVHSRAKLAAGPRLVLSAVLPDAGEMADAEDPLPTEGTKYSLKLANLHTGELLDVVYRIGDTYLPDAVDQLNHFLRDSHNDDVSSYDPREFDVLHTVLARLGRPDQVIDIVCGYRSQETNEMLREGSTAKTGVAEHSQHILGKAIDIRVPGVPTAHLRDAAMSLEAGGVGYYPKSQFVHVDVGPVRHWTFAPPAPGRHRVHRKRA
jgi:uncharacterized protein YcbK (DUF882 family)